MGQCCLVGVSEARVLQERYREGALNLSRLSKRQSNALFTPALQPGIILEDSKNTRYRVLRVKPNRAVLLALEQPSDGYMRVVVHFSFDLKDNKLIATQVLGSLNFEDVADARAAREGLYTVDELAYRRAEIQVRGDRVFLYGEYRGISDSLLSQIRHKMHLTERMHDEVEAEWARRSSRLLDQQTKLYSGRVIQL